MKKFTLLTSFFLCVTVFAQNGNEDKGIDDSGFDFPWELVTDRGKIVGCIYDNKYYSLGSILIEESVPRKCSLNSAREGFWSELSGPELSAFEEALEEDARREKEREERIGNSTYIGNKPITKEEAYIIRMIRSQVQKNSNKSLKQDK
jgi:hypothetical protein